MTKFFKKLEELINTHCIENDSNTPDFILAEFIIGILNVFNNTVELRDKWYECQGDGKALGENK